MDGMVEDEECEDVQRWESWLPYIEFGARAHYKEKVPPTEGSRA